MIIPCLINRKAYTPTLLLTREVFVSVGAMIEETKWLYWVSHVSVYRVSHVSVKYRMLQSLMSLWKAILAQILSTLLSRDWTLAKSILGSGARCAHYGAWPDDHSVCPFCGAVVLGCWLGSDPLSWVVDQKENPLWESCIPGRNVGELTLLLYPIVPPGSM